jgi:hypothetical protein
MRILFLLLCSNLFLNTPAFANKLQMDNVLKFIRHYEAPAGYNSYHSRIRVKPPKPLTQLTIKEVQKWQYSLKNVESTAAGGYQIIKRTLKRLVARYKVNENRLFDVETQDYLATLLFNECGYKHTAADKPRLANCLAGIWAALPLVTGPKKGLSVYDRVGSNKARTTPENVMAVLNGLPVNFKARPKKYTIATRSNSKIKGSTKYNKIKNAMAEKSKNGELKKSVVYIIDPYKVD